MLLVLDLDLGLLTGRTVLGSISKRGSTSSFCSSMMGGKSLARNLPLADVVGGVNSFTVGITSLDLDLDLEEGVVEDTEFLDWNLELVLFLESSSLLVVVVVAGVAVLFLLASLFLPLGKSMEIFSGAESGPLLFPRRKQS